MVEHDETRMRTWAQERENLCENKKWHMVIHWSVLAVQSVACSVVLLLALLLRVAGGEAFCSLKQRFQQALIRNEWVSTAMLLWDGNILETAEMEIVKEDALTEELPKQTTASIAALAPLESGTLTSSYGQRVHPINGMQEFHTGVDIAAPIGMALWAVCDGEVAEVGADETLGKFIRLNHGEGIEVVYGHCSEILAPVGADVKAGERVALVGSTGVSTGSHVHIRVNIDGVACDPSLLLPLDRYV